MLLRLCRHRGGLYVKIALLSFSIPLMLYAISSGAPAGNTGSPTFREPSCAQSGCHPSPANPSGGSLAISVPDVYTPGGAAVPISVTITDSAAGRGIWGFQLSARFRDGRQAGTFGFTPGVQVIPGSTGVLYATHNPAVLRTGNTFTYQVNWTPPADASRGDVVFSAAGNAGNADGTPDGTRNGGDRIFTAERVSSAPSTTPARIFAGGIVNAATFIPAPNNTAAPGMLVSIFGENLAASTAVATSLPLPTELAGTTVTVGGVRAPLIFVSAGQINAQVPFEVAAGSTVDVVVLVPPRPNSAPEPLRIEAGAPGIFTINVSGTGPGAILHANSATVVGESAPARPGGFISVFATGLGVTTPRLASGAAGNAERCAVVPTVTIGGASARVDFAGAAPGFAGLYQLNVVVPTLAAGDHEIIIDQGGTRSRTGVTVRVQP